MNSDQKQKYSSQNCILVHKEIGEDTNERALKLIRGELEEVEKFDFNGTQGCFLASFIFTNPDKRCFKS